MRSLEFGDHDLTPREREVAALVAQGLTAKEIADSLFVSVPTVKSHLREIFRKCGLPNRAALAAWWVAHAGEREVRAEAEPQVAIAEATSPSGSSARTGRRWRRPFFALAAAVAAGITAVFLSPLGANPFAVGADDRPAPPPPPEAPGWSRGGGGFAFRTTDGRPLEVEERGQCRLVETRTADDGWVGLETVFPQGADEPPETITEGWVNQGVYDCPYSYVVRSAEGLERTVPAGTVACFVIHRSVGEDEGWYDGIVACEQTRPDVAELLKEAGFKLADAQPDP